MHLKKGLKKTLIVISEHKFIFILLIILQLLALVAFSYTAIIYQVKILENAQGITQAMQGANFNPESIQAGKPFIDMDDLYSVYRNYDSLLKQVYQLLFWMFLLFIVFNGLAWIGVHHLFRKISFLQAGAKFLAAASVLLGPLMLLFYFLFKNYAGILGSFGWILLIIMGMTYYLLLVSFAFINVKPWKGFLRQIFNKGIKQVHWTLVVLLINLVLIGNSVVLIYLASEKILLCLAAIVLLSVVLVFTRIYWLACLQGEP